MGAVLHVSSQRPCIPLETDRSSLYPLCCSPIRPITHFSEGQGQTSTDFRWQTGKAGKY